MFLCNDYRMAIGAMAQILCMDAVIAAMHPGIVEIFNKGTPSIEKPRHIAAWRMATFVTSEAACAVKKSPFLWS